MFIRRPIENLDELLAFAQRQLRAVAPDDPRKIFHGARPELPPARPNALQVLAAVEAAERAEAQAEADDEPRTDRVPLS